MLMAELVSLMSFNDFAHRLPVSAAKSKSPPVSSPSRQVAERALLEVLPAPQPDPKDADAERGT